MYGYTVFHEKIIKTLINNVHNGTTSHAYIFDGRKGLNKHEAAALFAQALTCHNTAAAPCGACPSCIEAKANTNPDIKHIERETENGKQKKYLGIKPIRKAIETLQINPFNSSKKVYVIDEGELLNTEAQNAFLKTLEEPPEFVAIIIVTDNASSLLPTVLSRAELIHFPPVGDNITEKYLMEKYPEKKESLPFYVKYCEGIPGEAERLLNDENFEELRNESLKNLEFVLSFEKQDAFSAQKFVNDNSENAAKIFDLWLSFLRDLMVICCGASENVINTDKSDILERISLKYDIKRITNAIDLTIESQNMISRSVKASAVALRLALLIKEKN